jgi:cation-transporting ATPase 13A1
LRSWRAEHVLVVSGPALRAAERADAAGTRAAAPHVSVFARMTPSDKEMLLRWLRENGDFTLMCGDGANDVGALKQAHVGLALLSGFGTANTAGEGEKMLHEQTDEERKAGGARPLAVRQAERSKQWAAERAKDIAEMKELQQVYYREEYEQLTRERSVGGAQGDEERRLARHGRDAAPQRRAHARRFGGGAAARQRAGGAGGVDGGRHGRPRRHQRRAGGQARRRERRGAVHVEAAVDSLVRRHCAPGPLHARLDGAESADHVAQRHDHRLLAVGARDRRRALWRGADDCDELLLSVAGMAFTYARPVDQLAPTQPIGSIFHPAMALSTIGQL